MSSWAEGQWETSEKKNEFFKYTTDKCHYNCVRWIWILNSARKIKRLERKEDREQQSWWITGFGLYALKFKIPEFYICNILNFQQRFYLQLIVINFSIMIKQSFHSPTIIVWVVSSNFYISLLYSTENSVVQFQPLFWPQRTRHVFAGTFRIRKRKKRNISLTFTLTSFSLDTQTWKGLASLFAFLRLGVFFKWE